MLIILVPFLFFTIWLININRSPEKGIRRTFLETTLVSFTFIAVSTEAFSAFGAISSLNFILLWCGAILFLLAKFRREIRNGVKVFQTEFREKIRLAPKVYLGLSIFVYLITFAIALFSPPNTYDSMTYHLARVANWIQFGSVGHYPTAILRQLYQPPLAEFGILHFHLLSGSDYFANLVQWLTFPACGAAASLIAKEFNQDAKTQGFAAFLTATIPAAIIQSSSTQNDLISAFFVLAFFYFLLLAVKSNARGAFLWTGLSLGLAVLTKGSGYVFCFPIGLYFVVVHFLTLKKFAERRNFAMQITLVLMLAASLNFGHYARNYKLFGSPVSTGEDQLANKNLTAKIAFSNFVRNYALHLGSSSFALNNSIEKTVKDALGSEIKNPDSTWRENDFVVVYSMHEDRAGNLIHIILLTLSLFLIFLIRGSDAKYIYGAAFSICLGFLLFILLLKWQIWGSRLHMPVFMLGAVLTATVVGRLLPRIMFAFAALIFLFSLPFLYASEPRRIWESDGTFSLAQPRETKYFDNLPDLEPFYKDAVSFIKSQPIAPESIGLHLDDNEYEYPLWLMLKSDFDQKPQIYHVGVRNVSSKYISTRPMPEFIISTRNELTIENTEYKEVWSKFPVKVLQKK